MVFSPQPKPVKWRSKKYIEYIQSLPCENCGNTLRSVAHHESCDQHMANKGTGTKISDSMLIPLCGVCHSKRHSGQTTACTFWGERLKYLPFRMMQWLNDFLAGEK